VPSTWSAALAAEPAPCRWLQGESVDRALRAMAAFADLKSVHTRTHSSGVAELAAAAAERARLASHEAAAIRRAALLHDIGRPGVSAGIWDKAGPLTEAEWERVRMHTYFAERILSRAPALAEAGALASLAHERLDGKGYHRRLPVGALGMGARILAAADVYHAMCEPRAHRPALAADQAADELRKEARAGRLDADAVAAVLESSGHKPQVRAERPGGVSDREVEVLRLVARGLTNKEIGAALGISTKTAGHHLQHIFEKIGVTTRSAAGFSRERPSSRSRSCCA
jgi:HD-GYP domain-containing protein (c-di-GMP phosphodiesterase class II)